MRQESNKPTTLIPPHHASILLREDLAHESFTPMPAALTADGIDIRIDWDGTGEQLGRFEVRSPYGTWEQCQNLAPLMDANDLIYPTEHVAGESLSVRFHRGPSHPGLPFKVRALPIRWLEGRGPGPSSALPATYEAVRYVDYTYDIPDTTDIEGLWQESSSSDNVQCFVLDLAKGQDYEVWVTLQSPLDPDVWLPHDPIISPDSGNPGNNPNPK